MSEEVQFEDPLDALVEFPPFPVYVSTGAPGGDNDYAFMGVSSIENGRLVVAIEKDVPELKALLSGDSPMGMFIDLEYPAPVETIKEEETINE